MISLQYKLVRELAKNTITVSKARMWHARIQLNLPPKEAVAIMGYMQRRTPYQYYDLLIAASVATLLISNLGAVKLIAFGPIIADGGAVLFPLAYILGDVLTEVYGYKYTRRAIWVSFFWLAVMVAVLTIVRWLPAADAASNVSAFDEIFGFVPRIVLASLLAYLAGEFMNSLVLAKMKIQSRGKHMWQRLIGSTVIGETVDTTIFGLVAFGGILGSWDMFKFILIGVIFKTTVEIVMLPVTYAVIRWLKAKEHEDYFDEKTNFNPLRITLSND